MLFDFQIPTPLKRNTYELHRLVAATFDGEEGRNLFCDYGDYIRVRSSQQTLNRDRGTLVVVPRTNAIVFIELRASCYVSGGGKKYFLKQGDWRARHAWLEKKGVQNGFSVLNVTCQSQLMKVPKPNAEFTLDCTDFAACIEVEDTDKFEIALREGIGSKGRAFGFGMLVL